MYTAKQSYPPKIKTYCGNMSVQIIALTDRIHCKYIVGSQLVLFN